MVPMKRLGIAVGTVILLAGVSCAKPQPAPAVTRPSEGGPVPPLQGQRVRIVVALRDEGVELARLADEGLE